MVTHREKESMDSLCLASNNETARVSASSSLEVRKHRRICTALIEYLMVCQYLDDLDQATNIPYMCTCLMRPMRSQLTCVLGPNAARIVFRYDVLTWLEFRSRRSSRSSHDELGSAEAA